MSAIKHECEIDPPLKGEFSLFIKKREEGEEIKSFLPKIEKALDYKTFQIKRYSERLQEGRNGYTEKGFYILIDSNRERSLAFKKLREVLEKINRIASLLELMI